jgi:hypothetical protein
MRLEEKECKGWTHEDRHVERPVLTGTQVSLDLLEVHLKRLSAYVSHQQH